MEVADRSDAHPSCREINDLRMPDGERLVSAEVVDSEDAGKHGQKLVIRAEMSDIRSIRLRDSKSPYVDSDSPDRTTARRLERMKTEQTAPVGEKLYTSRRPVLSPILSIGAPALCRIVSSRFDIGVSSG